MHIIDLSVLLNTQVSPPAGATGCNMGTSTRGASSPGKILITGEPTTVLTLCLVMFGDLMA